MDEEKFISSANSLKSKAGATLTEVITDLLSNLQDERIIESFESKKHFSHIDYPYKKAYYANFIINTLENKKIVVFSTNSFRQDRAKTGFYDLNGIKENAPFKEDIEALIYLVNKPGEEFQNVRNRILNGEYYCPATHLFTIDDFITFLSSLVYKVRSTDPEEESTDGNILEESKGSYYGKRGNEFEKEIVLLLNDRELFEDFISGAKTPEPYSKVIGSLLQEHNIKFKDVLNVFCSNTVPPLRSGGPPKTDIWIEIKTYNRAIISTVSLKSTEQNQVSCHDYKVDDFLRVLNCHHDKLGLYLRLFQDNPSYKAVSEAMDSDSSIEEFSYLLKAKRKTLFEWAMKGLHDDKNLVDRTKQVSNYLLIRCNEEFRFLKIDEYFLELSRRNKGKLDGIFGWTYPSKQKKKRIQLKVPILI